MMTRPCTTTGLPESDQEASPSMNSPAACSPGAGSSAIVVANAPSMPQFPVAGSSNFTLDHSRRLPATMTPHAEKLNGSLYLLHKPVGKPTMEILFFHGLQFGNSSDPHVSAWKSRDGSHIWLQTWLVEEFPGAGIYTVSYDECLRKSSKDGKVDLNLMVENLISDLIELGKLGQEARCPVILVGHSFGGLVIKHLCLQAQETVSLKRESEKPKLKKFLERVQGMVFYGTPHHGSAPFLESAPHFVSGLLLDYVGTLSHEAARLNFNFELLRRSYNNEWRIMGLGEKLPTTWGLFQDVVVPEASARYGAGAGFVMVTADHISLCKPRGKTSNSFLYLTKLLKNVARKVSLSVPEDARADSFTLMPRQAIGIIQQVDLVKERLKGATSLGIVGVGGIGKTTLAKAVYNNLGIQFEYSCFLQDVKKIDGGVDAVTKEMCQHMHFQGKKISTQGDLNFLTGSQLLLILDDVSGDERDLQVLWALMHVIHVHADSRFILTCRGSTLMESLDALYEVPLLKEGPSAQLLLSHAFPNHRAPPPSFQGYIDEVVKVCRGLPLALEVLGKYLYKSPDKVWEQTIMDLKNADEIAGSDDSLLAKLKLSFNGLKEEEQEMFVEAATVFSSWPLCKAKAVWSITMHGAEHLRWQYLVNKSLVSEADVLDDAFYNPWREDVNAIFNPLFNPWREDGRIIQMHDLLQDMGKKIALSSLGDGKHSRFLDSRGAWDFVSVADAVEEVVALHLDRQELEGDSGLGGIGDSNKGWSSSLVTGVGHSSKVSSSLDTGVADTNKASSSLSLQSGVGVLNMASSSSRPAETVHIARDTLCRMGKLQYLVLKGGVEIDGLDEGGTFPTNLVFLQLRDGLFTKLPFDPSLLKRLAVLELTNCAQLLTLPETFGQLSALKILEIELAQTLVSLPNTLGQLAHLERLTLIGCPMLKALPEDLGRLAKLKYLGLEHCGLQTLPESLGMLSQLQFLGIVNCHELRTLPDSFGLLSNLEKLTIKRCSTLRSLPGTFGELSALKTLQLIWCQNLQLQRDSLANLRGLENLRIHFCNFRTVPKTFSALKLIEFSSYPKGT